jgi:lactam utilization protein B
MTVILTTDPGFPDKIGFGRRMLAMDAEQAYAEMCVLVGWSKTRLTV